MAEPNLYDLDPVLWPNAGCFEAVGPHPNDIHTLAQEHTALKAKIQWAGDKAFSYESDSGHHGYVDGAAKDGGDSRGPSPMELMLCGLGGCTSYDVVNILRKSRQDVVDCEATLDAERADGVPAVFTRIHIHFTVTGRNLKPAQVERAVKLSAEKYCSASMMLERGGVEISHDFEIVEAD